jgi:Ribonuclease G/E
MRVRVRGIYATALTHLFREADHVVVQASPPIRERFEGEFAVEESDIAIETTDDRQGIGIHGDSTAVSTATTYLASLETDTFSWSTDMPREAVFAGQVTETLKSGAVVDCGNSSGFLPYSNMERQIEEGDRLRVQVSDSVPPWSDDRPVLDTHLEVGGSLVRLVRDGSVDTSAQPGTAAGLTDVLPNDPPDGWRARWTETSEEAEFAALSDALAAASARATAINAALSDAPESADESGVLWSGRATTWVWFGRASRFTLDDARRTVCPTMAGHHRIKAGSAEASAAVEFVEAVCDPDGTMESAFPFETVVRQFGPDEGDGVRIVHGKPDGRQIVLGEGVVTDRDESSVTVRREMTPGGTYDALGVERRAGDTAVTKLTEGKWWYPTIYRDTDGERRGTYVNICTPVEIFPDAARYVDLYVDVVKHADGRIERVDDAELDTAVSEGHVSETLAETTREVADTLENAL